MNRKRMIGSPVAKEVDRVGEGVTSGVGLSPKDLLRAQRGRRVVAIRIHRGDEEPLVLSLERARSSTLLLGRGDNVDCRINDNHVSRVHGFLRGDGDTWSYVDVGSANGSFIEDEGKRVQLRAGEPVLLAVGEEIVLAGARNRLVPLAKMPKSQVDGATRSPVGIEFEHQLASLAPSRLPVFLLGSSGSGKTWAAKVLHDHSRRTGQFVSLNCARLAQDPVQLQSALLGHVKGAFTGAEGESVGAFFAADGGTLFLDEVESLSPMAQGFLLDLLEPSGQLQPLGASHAKPRPRPVVRIISASKLELRRTSLRNDLCHRLASGELVRVPHLHERRQDIPGLVEKFTAHFVAESQAGGNVSFSPAAVEALTQSPWDGEVRELRSTVETLVDRALRTKPIVEVDDVNERLEALRISHGVAGIEDDFPQAEETLNGMRRPTGLLRGFRGPAVPLHKLNPRTATEADVRAALNETEGNIDRAAALLQWSRNTLTKKMDEFGVRRPSTSGTRES